MNEITVIPQLLDSFLLMGYIATILTTPIRVQIERFVGDHHTYETCCYYISPVQASAAKLLANVRAYRGIECLARGA